MKGVADQNACSLIRILGFYKNLQGCSDLKNTQFATNLGLYEAMIKLYRMAIFSNFLKQPIDGSDHR